MSSLTSHAPAPSLTRSNFLAPGLLLLVALAFVWPLFVPGWIIPQGGGDLVSFLWPTYRYAARALHDSLGGRTPFSALLWNPTLYSGAPFAADNQTGLFYPPNLLLFLLFPDFPYPALEALVAFHLYLAGLGMYRLMRFEIGDRPLRTAGALLSAIAFMASDVFITHLGNYNIVAVSAYLPWLMLCLRRSFGAESSRLLAPGGPESPASLSSRVRWAILAGVAFGLAALAGHAQMTLILATAGSLYGLYALLVWRQVQILMLGVVSALVAFGLAAVALLPALEMLRYTARAALDYAEASRWSLPPLGLAGLISPLVFGRGARDFWPPWDRVECGYLGLVALSPIVFARGNAARFYWLLAAAGLGIALGQYTPIHFLLYKFIPGFASLRVPARFILLTSFALAAQAGCGLASVTPVPGIMRTEIVRRTFARSAAGLAALGVGIFSLGFVLLAPPALGRQPDWRPALVALALMAASALLLYRAPGWLPLLLFVELFVFGAFVEVDRADPTAGYRPGPAVDYLRAQPGPTRIDVASGRWQPDAPAVFGLESVAGLSNPLAIAAYDRYYWSVGYRGSPHYNFLNAQFVVADKNSPPADSTFVPVFNEDPEVDVYLNTNARPRISLVADPIFVDSDAAAFAAIHAPTFDPTSQVVLEASILNEASRVEVLPSQVSNLYYLAYAPGQFTIGAVTPTPAYLVLAEVWYPGWAATINGRPVPILRANTAFMAIRLPPGESQVEFKFTSPWLVVGSIVTTTTLLACALLLVRLRRP